MRDGSGSTSATARPDCRSVQATSAQGPHALARLQAGDGARGGPGGDDEGVEADLLASVQPDPAPVQVEVDRAAGHQLHAEGAELRPVGQRPGLDGGVGEERLGQRRAVGGDAVACDAAGRAGLGADEHDAGVAAAAAQSLHGPDPGQRGPDHDDAHGGRAAQATVIARSGQLSAPSWASASSSGGTGSLVTIA
jgi:hypothetical protein